MYSTSIDDVESRLPCNGTTGHEREISCHRASCINISCPVEVTETMDIKVMTSVHDTCMNSISNIILHWPQRICQASCSLQGIEAIQEALGRESCLHTDVAWASSPDPWSASCSVSLEPLLCVSWLFSGILSHQWASIICLMDLDTLATIPDYCHSKVVIKFI